MASIPRLAAIAALLATPCGVCSASTILFSHDFENAPNPGAAVTSVADLGAPDAGSLSFSGSPVGGIGGNANPGRRALAVGHNANGINNMTQMAENSVTFDAIADPVNFSFPETQVADAGSGDRVFADFATNGAFTGGESTEISFLMASFGNQNTGQFKHQFVRGLDASGAEVFELLVVSGSGAATRQVYARGADDDSITLAAMGSGTPEGMLLASNFAFGLNGTGVGNGRPSGMYSIGVTLENGMVSFDIGATGGAVTTTAANGTPLSINSSATTISRLEFSSVWNASENGGNKGYWVDNIVATSTIPEPAAGLIAALGVAGLASRRRN